MTRLLDLTASQLTSLDRAGLRHAVRDSEGRVVAAEVIGPAFPLIDQVSNAELVAAMGADLIILNLVDVTAPTLRGMPPCPPDDVIHQARRLTGRPLGLNLEPVGVPAGHLATQDNARRAVDLGIQMVVVTANPSTGADNAAITRGIEQVSTGVGQDALVVGGRMHAAGVAGQSGRSLVAPDDVAAFVEAGADMVLLPAPGTVPGLTLERVGELAEHAHTLGALVLASIGTSQEGADEHTVRTIALAAKQAGADVLHLGDAGYTGVAVPTNITTASVAIRGVRHTWRRMAWSPLR